MNFTARTLMIAWITTAFAPAVAMAQTTTRVSVSSQGTQGNFISGDDPSRISADGRFIAFDSASSNLVPGDTNGFWDVFVHNQATGETTIVSVDSNGNPANSASADPAISADGRFVAFSSDASNLVPGDTNGFFDVFVHDRFTGETTRVSVDSAGNEANKYCGNEIGISGDGRFVAFMSRASNLVPGDTGGFFDVFVHDRATSQTTRVSVDSSGVQGNEDSGVVVDSEGGSVVGIALSSDGRFVAFASEATNLIPGGTSGVHVFVHDRVTGETSLASKNSNGSPGNGRSEQPAISANGRFVAFQSTASNLFPGDNTGSDVFVHDRVTGITRIDSVNSSGKRGNNFSGFPDISADGRYTAFYSFADNLVSGDTNGKTDVFRHDSQTGETVIASADSQGNPANGFSNFEPGISADGRYVAFASEATNLVPGDTNGFRDTFVHDQTPGACGFAASWTNYGVGWPGTNGIPNLVAGSDPILCTTVALVADNSSGADTHGALLIGLEVAHLPTAWGGTILLLPRVVLPLQLPAAGLSLNAPVPCDASLCGLAVFLQIIEFDPGASLGISFTPGLDLNLGT